MGILEKYGIREVANVTFYDITSDGKIGAPQLFLDTLKVSTIEQTASTARQTGGVGNAPLIIWDYGKEIKLSITDALFSPKSLAVMFGNGKVTTTATSIQRTSVVTASGTSAPVVTYTGADGAQVTVSTGLTFYDENGSSVATYSANTKYLAKYTIPATTAKTVEISADSFPGTYYVTGDTVARNQITGKDEFFQFVVPKAKMNAEHTITLEAEGDASVFDMSLTVLRSSDGKLMQLIQYSL